MMDQAEAFTLAKLGALEKLLEVMYVEHFETFGPPIKAADELAEAVRAF